MCKASFSTVAIFVHIGKSVCTHAFALLASVTQYVVVVVDLPLLQFYLPSLDHLLF